jgi:hypothetical protein
LKIGQKQVGYFVHVTVDVATESFLIKADFLWKRVLNPIAQMENMLEEYMADMMIDAEMYKEESFEAFESDEDSMLILGQPIDDQITTKNIASFAIPQKKRDDGSVESENEECDYEESFESPSPAKTNHPQHGLSEMSSITFNQSKYETQQHYNFPEVIREGVPLKKKGKKKKKRVPPAASMAAGAKQDTAAKPQQSVPTQSPRGNSSLPPTGPASVASQAANQAKFRNDSLPPTGSRNSARVAASIPSRIHSAGMPSASSTAATRGASSSSSRASGRPGGEYPAAYHSSQPYADQQQYQQQECASAHQYTPRAGYTPGAPGPGSVISHANTSAAGRAQSQGVASANGMLQRQLDNALKQVSIYRRENEMLQANLDSAGINEAVERYKALLLEKEQRLFQLESENNGLKSIARYQGKYLADQARDHAGGVDSVRQHEKQIEIMLVHTRKMKEKAKKLEIREKELVAENEHLHTQNVRIQRKNTKLKKQVAELTKAMEENDVVVGEEGSVEQEEGAVSTSILDSVLGQEGDGTAGQAGAVAQTSVETLSSANTSTIVPKLAPKPAVGIVGEAALTAAAAPVMTKAALKKALEEKEAVVQRQQQMIETLERSLQTQRARLVREMEGFKQQAEQAAEEQHRLEAELEKRERFGRNQVRRLF